jgi:hypothetical protein
MTVSVKPLPERPVDWDARISRYESAMVFDTAAWHDHLKESRPDLKFEYAQLMAEGKEIGYFSAARMSKALLTILGSPMPGTGTNYMGPIMDPSTAIGPVVDGILRYARGKGAAHLELAHPRFDTPTMRAAGMDVHEGVTHVVPLSNSEDQVFKGLKSTCRNRIRKAEGNGLVGEVTEDPSIVDHFFAQFNEVYAKQGMSVPFGIERPRALFRHLVGAGMLLPVWVRKDAEVLAAGLFPYDRHSVYFWGAGSWLKYQQLCPNELLHWTVMREAVKRGVSQYNMCGGGSQFKDKFGGADVPYVHYSKSLFPGLRPARELYRKMHWLRLRLTGRLRGLGRPTSVAPDDAESRKEMV